MPCRSERSGLIERAILARSMGAGRLMHLILVIAVVIILAASYLLDVRPVPRGHAPRHARGPLA